MQTLKTNPLPDLAATGQADDFCFLEKWELFLLLSKEEEKRGEG
jgi:hypothetical protein